MSKQRDLLQLDKCIFSRLWYVATTVHQRELIDRCRHRRNVKTLKDLIIACTEQRFRDQRWIAYNLSAQIEDDKEIKERLNHEEFVCTLNTLETQIPEDAREELIRLFEAVKAAVEKTEVHTCQLSEKSLKCLESNMLQCPSLAHWIIDGLLCIWLPTTFAHSDSTLQRVYFSSIKKILDKLVLSTENKDVTDLGILLSILSKLDLIEEKEHELLAWMFPVLLKTVDSKDVELAFYSRRNLKFFQAWHEFLDDNYARLGELNNLENALKVMSIIVKSSENLTTLNANEIFKRILRRKTHWLVDILNLCCVLLVNEKYREVEKILATPGFRNFWLPLLFKVWNEKSENSAAMSNALRFVLRNFRAIGGTDLTLERLMNTLENHLKVLDYILKDKKIQATNNGTTGISCSDLSAKNILNLLKNESVLVVLKTTINIHKKPYEEINDLLGDNESSKNIFQAYRTMLSALRGILNCNNYNEKYREVAEHLDDVEKSLGSLFPLDFRIKVIKNIFSMTFLRNKDFVRRESSSDSEDVDSKPKARGNSNGTKNLAQAAIGFVCNKYAIREILARLERSLVALELEYAEQKKDGKLSVEFCNNLEKSIAFVSQTLADAAWRLELLTNAEFVKKSGIPDSSFERRNKSQLLFDDERLDYSIHSRSKMMFYKSWENSSGKSEFAKSDVDESFESGSQGSTGSKRRKRSKNQVSPLNETSSSASKVSTDPGNTLNCMLASKDSLVLQCLWKNDYERAARVIEMFDLKNSRMEGEILFSRAMHAFREDLRAQWNNADTVDSPGGISEQSTLENIRKAVQDGFQASRMTSQIETFLAAQESSVHLLRSDTTSTKAILTMASLDLALTMSRTRQDSINFGDVTMKYLKSSKQFLNTRYDVFFESVYKLLFEEKRDSSIKEILLDARIPLSVEKARGKNDYWTRLKKKLEAFRRTRTESHSEESFDLCDKHFEDVISICENGEPYLPRVYAHLNILRSIAPESSGENFRFLETSLDDYIGEQIFRLNVELEEIESVASRLQVNLVHSILVNCCPKLSCSPGIRSRKSGTWGFVVLNEAGEENDSPDCCASWEPNQCVCEILSELLDALREEISPDASLSRESARRIARENKIREILGKTRRLASLDLSNLSFGHHTLAFFINVWNLLMIHAILEVWSEDPPLDDLRREIAFSSVGYDVGDLGTVSLVALRSKLLGQSQFFGSSQYFSQTEELNEPAWQDLDVPYEPRVLFAMTNELEDTPVVRIYTLKSLDDDLEASMTAYLRHYGIKDTNLFGENEKNSNTPSLVQMYSRIMTSRFNKEKERHVDPDARVARNYSYKINFCYEEESTERREEETSGTREFPWQNRVVKSSLLEYLEGRCWLLSYLVQRIHEEESPTILHGTCENLDRTAALENLLKSPWNGNLKCLCEGNETVSALRKIVPTRETWNVLEGLLASDDADKCLDVLNALPDSLMFRDVELQRLRDKILIKLATSPSEFEIPEILRHVYRIRDEHLLAQIILDNANKFPVKVCQEALLHALSHRRRQNLPAHSQARMNEILCRVTVFYKMLPYCSKRRNQEEEEDDDEDETWHNIVYRAERTNPLGIVKSLIEANQYELCLEWLEYQAVSSEIDSLITEDLLVGLLANDDTDFKHSLKLLRALPVKKSVKLCRSVVARLESIDALRFVIGYLQDNEVSESQRYRQTLLGVDILEQLDVKERRFYAHLIDQPLSMLEQLLMNCRLDGLQRIVAGVGESKLREHALDLDETLRFYAKKSLDFRVAVQLDPMDKIKDASISSVKSQSVDFVMPLNIPTKEEWVPNHKARECSCCRVVIFSMFNRRHHCRRCGRVVCGACSPQRMRLPNYPSSVPVRVCNDCKRQSLVQQQTAPSTPSSEIFDCWRLNVDETYNKTLRDEFSFENAPNISLCLAILSLHSDCEAYSDFLLDRCDEMKCLLRPDSKGRVNPEIDHALIIKMIRSLLVAAKVKYAELGLNTGLTHCDRFLSQVDLIATLVNSECSYLIPRIDKEDHLDDHTLRRLRDMLMEKEEWRLALDVSTKTGLDTQGVWAAWGTACLKVGYYERARDKFVHCLDKVLREDYDDWVMLSYPGEASAEMSGRSSDAFNEDPRRRTSSKSQEGLKSRPSKDPPLLTEILQILEKANPNDAHSPNRGAKSKYAGAQEILNMLSSLKAISQGWSHLAAGQSVTGIRSVRYQESLYYLLMYGSFGSILEFFVRHGEYDKCLAYVIENDIEPELFMNHVFLLCVKSGCSVDLCETMRSKDPSLLTFKKYLIYTCHMLEKKQFLHTLHQLQLFMKDYVRASMTCIRFYVAEASTYDDLSSRSHLLLEAQKYLESELQLENFGRKRRKSVSSSQSGQSGLTLEMDPVDIDRHINTISRQMEIAKFLSTREREGKSVSEFMSKLSYMENEGSSVKHVPTLFGNQQEKTHLAVLAILCGRDVEEGFGMAFRIMQDYNLQPQKIYSLVGHMLALDQKISSIEQLVKCCRSSGAPNSNAISDRVLAHCVKLLVDRSRADSTKNPTDQIDALIRIITDVELKIESYIESRQLKAAYLLAVKHARAQDIRKILKEADRLGQLAIKSICTKWLQQAQKSRLDS